MTGPTHQYLGLDFRPGRDAYVEDISGGASPMLMGSIRAQVARAIDDAGLAATAVTGIRFDSSDGRIDTAFYEMAAAIIGASAIRIADTYGPAFDMDRMCDGATPPDASVGDGARLEAKDGRRAHLTISALDAHRTESGEIDDRVGIGFRGEAAEFVQPGDVLLWVPAARD